MGAAGVLRIVQVHGAQPLDADDAIEFVKHAVKVVHDIVPTVVHMARVQAHAHVVGKLHALDDGCQLLKRTANFRAFACHGFQQNRGGLLGAQHLVEQARNQFDTHIGALLHVASRVEVVVAARYGLHAHQVVGHAFASKLARVRLVRAWVQRIGRMRHQRAEVVSGQQFAQRRGVSGIDCLRRTAARIARKEGERVGADAQRGLSHGKIAL